MEEALHYYCERWGKEPDAKLLSAVAERIAWNLWQMDGLKDTVPLGKTYAPVEEISLFDIPEHEGQASMPVALPCRIKNWRRQKYICFRALKVEQLKIYNAVAKK